MRRPTVDHFELMLAHQYAEVAAACEEGLRARPNDAALLGWHASALLGLGRLPEALEAHRLIHERERAAGNKPISSFEDMGGIQWMLGRQQEAIETFQAAIDGIADRSIIYADRAGGVTPGLLLWYAATTAGDAKAKQRALDYLRNRAKRRAIEFWPGPLALYVLETTPQEEVLRQACGTPRVEEAVRAATEDTLKRRHLINAMFCFATRSREQGAEDDCIRWMYRCAGLENPNVEIEWYLAHAEAERSVPPPPEAGGQDTPDRPTPGRRGFVGWLRFLKP
jgi:tetratricopeptide (TPR) repeat protein